MLKQIVTYRVYPDGTIVHQDDLDVCPDSVNAPSDDYIDIDVPQDVVNYIAATGIGRNDI